MLAVCSSNIGNKIKCWDPRISVYLSRFESKHCTTCCLCSANTASYLNLVEAVRIHTRRILSLNFPCWFSNRTRLTYSFLLHYHVSHTVRLRYKPDCMPFVQPVSDASTLAGNRRGIHSLIASLLPSLPVAARRSGRVTVTQT